LRSEKAGEAKMIPTLDEASYSYLVDTLGGRTGSSDPYSPQRTAADFIRSSATLLAHRLRTEIRVLHLVGSTLDAGVTELVVYGAAEVGQDIARLARAFGIRVPYFVESRIPFAGRCVDGIEVVGLARAQAEGFHAYAAGTVHCGPELGRIIRAAYQDHPEWPLQVFLVPQPVDAPAAPPVAGGIAFRERLLDAVLGSGPGFFGALLERLPREEEPAPPREQEPAPGPRAWAEDPLDARLLKAASPLWTANLQFTGDCNLKCTYCGHAQSGWSGTRMTEPMLEQILDFILQDRVKRVMVGFFGEATLFQGWEKVCGRLLDGGVELATNSNFQRPLRAEEVDILSRFTEVAMSIDTVDPELQKRLRPPMDVRNLVHALHRIRGRALAAGRKEPHFIWTGVLTPEVVPLLPELFSYAKSCGIRYLNMNDVTPIEESASMANLFDLEDDDFIRMTGQLGEAVTLAETLGLHLTAPLDRIAGRLERAQRRKRGEACPEPPKVRIPTFQGTAVFPFERIPEGKVGLCLAPWISANVMPTGEVFPCCFQNQVMGRIEAGQGLSEILDNDRYKAFRAALLTGKHLNETCRNCILVQKVVDPAEARAAVGELLGIVPLDPS
jgi:radical SAM protein with 4Fe4S-binding SPASM domain